MDAVAQYLLRRFIYYGAERYGLADKLYRFERLIRNYERRGRCLPGDVLAHYADEVFLKLVNNMRNEVKVMRGRDLLFRGVDVEDPIVSDNYQLLPLLFNFGGAYLCFAGGSTCVSNPSDTCVQAHDIYAPYWLCCTSSVWQFSSLRGVFADALPYANTYAAGFVSLSFQVPTTPGIAVLNFNFAGPSTWPTSGVTLYGPIITEYFTIPNGVYSCASSCPSNSKCVNSDAPILYFTASLTVYPNASYSAWIKFQIS